MYVDAEKVRPSILTYDPVAKEHSHKRGCSFCPFRWMWLFKLDILTLSLHTEE